MFVNGALRRDRRLLIGGKNFPPTNTPYQMGDRFCYVVLGVHKMRIFSQNLPIRRKAPLYL